MWTGCGAFNQAVISELAAIEEIKTFYHDPRQVRIMRFYHELYSRETLNKFQYAKNRKLQNLP